jgi:hypothetical protein
MSTLNRMRHTRRNKTMRRKLRHRQRSRRHKYRRHTRRQRGGDLPVPSGAVVAISTGGEYGVPILMSKETAEKLQESGGLEE